MEPRIKPTGEETRDSRVVRLEVEWASAIPGLRPYIYLDTVTGDIIELDNGASERTMTQAAGTRAATPAALAKGSK